MSSDPSGEDCAEAKSHCLRWQSMREHSQSELLQKLHAKGIVEATAREVVRQLAEAGLQSDLRYLESFVRSRYNRGQGSVKIRQALCGQGLDASALGDCLRQYDWDESLVSVHRRKFGESPPDSPKDYAARARFLLQRGFEPDRVQAFLRRLCR